MEIECLNDPAFTDCDNGVVAIGKSDGSAIVSIVVLVGGKGCIQRPCRRVPHAYFVDRRGGEVDQEAFIGGRYLGEATTIFIPR